MIVKLTVKDYDGFCHAFIEHHPTTESVAVRIYSILSDVSFVESVSVLRSISDDAQERLQYWGWFTYGDSFDKIYSYLNAA